MAGAPSFTSQHFYKPILLQAAGIVLHGRPGVGGGSAAVCVRAVPSTKEGAISVFAFHHQPHYV